MTARALHDLARSLQLTERQRRFAEALAADPTRNLTAAARTAGSRRPEERGCKWAKVGKVQRYLQALTGAAVERATEAQVSSLAESLAYLTTVQRGRLADYLDERGEVDVRALKAAPAGLVRRLKMRTTTDEEGQVFAQHEVELESALSAARELVAYHTGSKAPPPAGPQVNVQVVLASLPDGVLQQLAAALGPRVVE